jgi:alpha-1,3-mannosyltransferase
MSAGLLPVLEGNSAYVALAGKHGLMRIADFSEPEKAARALKAAWDMLQANPAAIRATLMAEALDYSWDNVALRYISLYRDALA